MILIRHVLLIFSILVSTTIVGEGATSTYEPTDVFLFNCGDTSNNVDDSGRNWTPENQKIMSSNLVNASFTTQASYQESGVPRIPYMTARIFRSEFTYSFPVTPGSKFLRLYFYPTRYGSEFNAVNSFFSVKVNGFTLLNNFSADLTVKASKTKTEFIIKEFLIPVYQTLNLTFTPSENSLAFVNGIEIVSMPNRFYTKGGFDDVITNVGSSVDFHIENSTAFETVYRLNVGGQTVRDSGMFRRWFSDDEVILSESSGTSPIVPDIKINYTDKTPAYVAPDDVYATSRSMGNADHPQQNLNFNLTWLFTVDAGFSYLVRLHFCETLREVNKEGQRVFSIFIENQMATLEMDVFRMSGGSWIPMYLDYTVIVGSGSGPRHDLRLDMHPLVSIKPKYYDAILNGVEILKLNDPDGNLAGPNPDPPMNSTPNRETPLIRKGNNKSHVLVITLAVVGSSIVLAMFIVGVVVIMKRKKKKKKRNEFSVHNTSSSWSPLPHGTGSTNTKPAKSLPSDLCRRFCWECPEIICTYSC